MARDLARACRDRGFFVVTGHGVDPGLERRLEQEARAFFSLPEAAKQAIAMPRAGRAWRGWFPLAGELTSGRPDWKEGLYFGAELGPDDPRVRAGLPLHGANLWPAELPGLRGAVLAWIAAMTALGHVLMEGIARSLDLPPTHFRDALTCDPFVLFRIFHYPPPPVTPDPADEPWGVGEHTDYGLLTILKQDDVAGLEVRTADGGWTCVPPTPGAFVCNLGDMLERMTGGWYRSTPHRVRNREARSRLSFPFFFDPGFDAEVRRLEFPGRAAGLESDARGRWDNASVHDFEGRYGDYLLAKVAKVFPELHREAVG